MALAQESRSYPRGLKESDLVLMNHQKVVGLDAGRTFGGGVKITEYLDTNVNPEPINQEEEADQILEDYLSPARLRSISGHRNLEDVTTLEMRVNTTDTSLSSLGQMLPNLRELKLSNSVVTSIRDLGTSLSSLKVLWMTRCGLCDLDGISSLGAVEELYLAFNEVVDVSPLSMLDTLEVLDLEGNMVDDITQVQFLALCSSLNSLTLEANPVYSKPHPAATEQDIENYDYRSAVLKALPSLKMLDNLPVLLEKVNGETVMRELPESMSKKGKIPEHLMDDFLHVTENLRNIDVRDDSDDSEALPGERPRSACGKRPGSAAGVRPSTARNRPGSAAQRPGSARGQRPGTACGERPSSASGVRENSSSIIQEDDSSSLTHGSSEVICGNISRALRARKKHLDTIIQEESSADESMSLFKFTPERSYADDTGDFQSREEIFAELNKWRQEYAKMLDEERLLLNRHCESESPSPPVSPRRAQSSTSPTSPSTPTPSAAHSPSPPITPSPPPSAVRRPLPNPMQRSFPLPPQAAALDPRPRTAADFRIRRFRQRSVDRPVHTGDESFDAETSQDFESPRVGSASSHPVASLVNVEPRSSSAPVALGKKHRVLPPAPLCPPQEDTETQSRPAPAKPVDLRRPRPGTAAVLEKRRIRPLNDPRLSGFQS